MDHLHERPHQHHSFLRYFQGKQSDVAELPNYPDVDLRDDGDEYVVDIELPGVKFADSIKCQWTTPTHLLITGDVSRPGGGTNKESSNAQTNGNDKRASRGKDDPMQLLFGERRIGPFRRHLSFPACVDGDSTIASLEAGLLSIRIPKHKNHISSGITTVKIDVVD